MALDLEEIGRLRRSQMLAAQADCEYIRSPLRWHDACATTAMTPVRQIGAPREFERRNGRFECLGTLRRVFQCDNDGFGCPPCRTAFGPRSSFASFRFRTAPPDCVLD